ncbi:MAG: cation:proton antiporter [Verrucomicrobiae bacterium]
MIGLAVLLGTAAAGYGLAQRFRLPVIPLLLALGFVMSLTGLAPGREASRFILDFGLAFLVFTAGVELNPRRFLHQTRPVLWVAIGQFALVGLAAFAVARWMGFGTVPGLYMAFATSASSTLVVVRQLKSRQQMFEPFGRLVTGVLLVQDLLLILAIVVLGHLGEGPAAVLQASASLLALAGTAVFLHWRVFPWIERTLRPDEETLLMISLALLFSFLAVSDALGIPLIAGAFLAGFVLSVFPINGLVRGLLGSLAEFFQAIFFAALGALVVFSSPWIVVQALGFSLLVLLITPPVVTVLAEWQGLSSRNAIESGLLLAQTSELSLVLGLVGVAGGHLGPENFSVIALTCATTMILTPFLATDRVTWKLLHWHPGRQTSDGFFGFENHTVLIGLGSSGMWIVKELRDAGHHVLVIDDDASVIAGCERNRIPCLRGDGSDPRILRRAGAKEARLIVATLPRPADVVKIARFAGEVPVVARIFDAGDARAVEEAGGFPVLSSEAALEKFLEWFDKSHPRPGPTPTDKAADSVRADAG